MQRYEKVTVRNKFAIDFLCEIATKTLPEYYSKILPEVALQELIAFYNFETIKDEIKFDNKNYFLIQEDNFDIGFFEYSCEDNILILNNLFLLKEYQRKKIGTKIIDFLKKISQENNFSIIRTYLFCENDFILNIFKKWGFKEIKDNAMYLGSDYFFYSKIFELKL